MLAPKSTAYDAYAVDFETNLATQMKETYKSSGLPCSPQGAA